MATFVQSVAMSITGNGTSMTGTITPTSGNFLVATVNGRSGTGATVSGPAGWSKAINNNQSSADVSIWFLNYTGSGAQNYAWTMSATDGMVGEIIEFNIGGSSFTGALDQTAVNNSTTATNPIDSGTTATTTTASQIWVAALGSTGSGNRTMSSMTSGWTQDKTVDDGTATHPIHLTTGYQIASATGAAHCQGTLSTAQVWLACVATFKIVATSTRTVPSSVALLATNTRNVPSSAALLATVSRAVPASGALIATNSRGVPGSAALVATNTRAIPATGALIATPTRTIPSSAALIGTATRAVPASGALLGTQSRQAPASAGLVATLARQAPANAAFLATQSRAVPASGALVATLTCVAPASAGLLGTATRAAPSSAALLATNNRQAPTSAALLNTQTRVTPAMVALVATLMRAVSAGAQLYQPPIPTHAGAVVGGDAPRRVASVSVSAVGIVAPSDRAAGLAVATDARG